MNDKLSYILPNNIRKELPHMRAPSIGFKSKKVTLDSKSKELISKYRKGQIWKTLQE